MSSSSQTTGKGPPPLPTPELPDAPYAGALGEVADVEEAFFLEGIDGRAESLLNESEAETLVLAPTAAPLECEEAGQADLEDAARARRRRLARIGVAWGATLIIGVVGAGAFMRPHADARSPTAVSASPAPIEQVETMPATASIAATPPGQAPLVTPTPAESVTSARSTVRGTTASTRAVGATHSRAPVQKKGAASSRSAKPSPASSKTSSKRAPQKRVPSARAAAPKSQARGKTTAAAGAKGTG